MASNNIDTDPASIYSNRFGQITIRQRDRLKSSLVAPVILLVVWFALTGPLGGLALYLAWELAQAQAGPAWFGVFVMLGVAALIAGLLWSFAVMPVARRARLQRDLSAGLIAQAEGQVSFERSDYAARVNGRLLRASDGSRSVGLSPGPYRFYFLPLTGYLLSAEALSPLIPAQARAAVVLDALARVHHFDLSDLAANRQGQLSARQRLRLARTVVVLQVVIAGLMGLLAWMVIKAPETEPWSALIIGLILAGVAYATYRRIGDLLDGQVAQIEGFVSRVENSGDESSTYYYVLDGQRFQVSMSAYAALVEGLRYRLYCTPTTRKLVSIEPLP